MQVTYKDFFKAFGYSEKDTLYLRRFHDKDKSQHPCNMSCELGQIDALAQNMKSFNENGYGIFFVVNGGGHDDKSVKTARAQFIDMDDFSFEEQWERVNNFPLEPSIIIKTKKSLHCYWLLDNGNVNQFEDVQKRLIQHFGSDSTIKNKSRVMRLYGFMHQKSEPVMVELIKFEPSIKYTQQQLLEVLPKGKGKAHTKSFSGNKSSDETCEYRVNQLISMVGTMRNKGLDDDSIVIAIKMRNSKFKMPLTDFELEKEVFPALKHSWTGLYKVNKNGVPYEIIDDRIADYILEKQNIIVIAGKPYIYKDGVYRKDDDGIRIKYLIKQVIIDELRTMPRINRVYQLIVSTPGIIIDIEDANKHPKSWINFKNGFLDVKSMQMVKHSPKYYSINQIPHAFEVRREVPADSVVKEFLGGVVPDPDDLEMLLQYIGYCMTTDTGLQKFLVVTGVGGTGKSTIIRMINKAIGKENISSLSLQDLNERFNATNLYGKTLNSCADIPSKAMEQVDIIKKITGEDEIKGEYKGGAVFFFRSYAKLLFSANEIPISLDDKTNAFYRRFLIIRIDKRCHPIERLEERLSASVDDLINLSVQAVHRMYDSGLVESQNSKNNVTELYMNSDTVAAFINDEMELGADFKVERGRLFDNYEKYCEEQGRFSLTRNGFYKSLRSKGYEPVKINGVRFFKGLNYVYHDFIPLTTGAPFS